MAKKNDPDGPLPKWGEPEGVKKYMEKTPKQTKTIKVGEDTVGSDKCHYALVMDRKVTATGTKDEMLAKCAEEGGRVWVSTKNVGDIVEAKYSVDVDGLPRFYMDADSPAQVKKALRALLRKASSIDSVERVNDAKIKQDLRQRIKGGDTDKRNVDEEVMDEGVKHDRYMRSHGKKASGEGNWMFTTKRTGSPSERETFSHTGKLGDGHKAAMKHFKSKNVYVMEKLDPSKHDAGDYIKDFKDSDAPQFKGKSMEKRRKMAVAAYLSARREKGLEEAMWHKKDDEQKAKGKDHQTLHYTTRGGQKMKTAVHKDKAFAAVGHFRRQGHTDVRLGEEVELDEGKINPALMAKLKKMKGKHGEMARFLANQGDVKELNKFLKKIGEETEMLEGYGAKLVKKKRAALKEGKECSCCGNEIVDGKCGCGPDCKHCGGKGKVDEASCGGSHSSSKSKKKVKEDVEQVDELSKGLKGRYLTKAQMDAFKKIDRAYKHEPESPESKKHMASAMKRGKGMALARKKMKEEVEVSEEDYGLKIRRYEMIKKAAKKIQRKAQSASKSDYKKSDKKGMADVKTEGYKVPSNYAAMMLKKKKAEAKKKLSSAQSKHMDTDKDGDIDGTDLKNLRKNKNK